MEHSFEEEIIEKEDRHANGLRLPKHHMKYGYLNKKLISRTDVEEFPEDCFDDNLRPSNLLSYSLNKKGRWNLLDEFRGNIEKYNDVDENVRVSALEKEITGLGGFYKRDTKAYHAVEDDGEALHKYTSKGYGVEHTLTEKPKPPKKGKGRRRGRSAPEQNDVTDQLDDERHHIRYEIVTQTPSDGLYEKERNKRYHRYTIERPKYKNSGRRTRMNFDEDLDLFKEQMDTVADDYWGELFSTQTSSDSELTAYETPLTCLQDFLLVQPSVDRAEKRSRKKQRNSNSESSKEDKKHGRLLLYQFDDDTDVVQITTENVVPPVVRPELIGIADFSMDSQEFHVESSELNVDTLVEKFSGAYYECACIPRRFCIDVSGKVRNVLHSLYPAASNLDIQAICVFEIAPPELKTCGDDDETIETNKIRVWLNGIFTNDVRSLILNSLETRCSIDDIIQSAVKTFTLLPFENYVKKESNAPITVNRLPDVHARVLDDAVSNYLHTHELTEIVLQKEELARKLQRQLTAVRTYDWFSDVGENTCGICLEWLIESSGFCLASCQHWFCKSCWRTYCSDRIRNGLIPVKCPDSSCDVIMDYDLLTTILPLPQCILFANQYRDRYITANSDNWVWCPNIKCGRIIHSESGKLRNSSVCSCLCGETWCAQCKGPVHWPATCEQTKNYYAKLKRDGNLNKAVHGNIKFVSVKKCPHCHLLMEKNTGCNYMMCRCGKAFCWKCGVKWDGFAPHGSCTGDDNTGFRQVKLVDYHKPKVDQIWSPELYERCLFHHQALRSTNTHNKLKRMISSSIGTNSNKQELIQEVTGSSASVEAKKNENSFVPTLINRSENVRQFVESFFELHYQYHYILEYTYLWLQDLSQTNKTSARRIHSLANRLTFMVTRLEDACTAGQLAKIVESMQSAKHLLRLLVNEIVSMKRNA